MKRGLLSAAGVHISRWFAALATGLLCFGHQADGADAFEQIAFEGARYLVNRIDPAKTELRLFLNDAEGRPYNRFDPLNKGLERQNLRLKWAMNGGMYHGDFRPVGLCVVEGKEISPINFENAEGNFFLKPNGIFAIEGGRAIVQETTAYHHAKHRPELATQSGPMLVVDGKIHPRFSPDSTSKLFRNGVGINGNGEAVFAITETPVNFHQFARFFRDRLGCNNALFLDGTISSLYSRALKRNDFRMNLGPIIGEVEAW